METLKTEYSNIPNFIEKKMGKKLHNLPNHPIQIIKNHIYDFFRQLPNYKFEYFDDLSSIVSVSDNFDKLLIPQSHPARSKSDTYYVNETMVLRTHTSAHQNELLAKGITSFIVTGDVYRKDEIDSRHYPVFHQMELLTLVDNHVDPEEEIKNILAQLVNWLFPNCEFRFNPDYFPFTHPSFEIEVKFQDKWLEILGCGVVQPAILEANGITGKKAIAAGFGLDRLAMIFTEIPDIRYIWSDHPRFISQYANGKLNKFIPYSELPSIYKDVSFYVNFTHLELDEHTQKKWLYENDFFEIIRNEVGDYIEEVSLIDSYYNKKQNKYSRTYRLVYSPPDPELKNPAEFNEWVNNKQNKLVEILLANPNIESR
jgi:phenylalanyl-tRNA synthetase alpha chain